MPAVLRQSFASSSLRRLSFSALCITAFSFALPGLAPAAHAQQPSPPTSAPDAAAVAAPATSIPAPAPAETPVISPRFLFKTGLRLTHLFYLPDRSSWQLVLPVSFGIEYRFRPAFSLFVQGEADLAAGRAPRGRRGFAPASGASLGFGGRYYFNQARARCAGTPAECWGNYLTLETNTDLSAAGRLRGGGRGRGRGAQGLTRLTPSLFVLLGTQHAVPGRRLLYDLNAGLGLEAPPPYLTEGGGSPSWNVAAQLNLRVYLVNHRQLAR